MSADQETVSTDTSAAPPAAASTDKGAPANGAATPDAAATDQAATDRDDKGRFRNPVQPRIDELTRKSRESEREAAYWRQRALDAEKPPEKAAEKPKVENFDDYGAFVEALADWKADEKIKANDAKREETDAKRRETSERVSSWEKRRDEAKSRIPDFDQVMSSSDVPVAEHVWEVIQEAERGPEVMHAMAKNPTLAEKLNAMSPKRAAIEIGRLEASLPAVSATPDPEESARTDDAGARAETPPPARRTSSAPPPIKPIAKGGSTAVDLSKLKGDDYVKARAAQGAKWARR